MNKDLNFFQLAKAERSRKKLQKFPIKVVVSLVVSLGLVIGFSIFMVSVSQTAAIRSSMLERSIESMATEEQLEKIWADKKMLEDLYGQLRQLERVTEEYEKKPRITTDILKTIAQAQPADLSVTSVEYSDGSITVNCTAQRSLCGADFAHALRTADKFADVHYAGVHRDGDSYQFHIRISLVEEQISDPGQGSVTGQEEQQEGMVNGDEAQ